MFVFVYSTLCVHFRVVIIVAVVVMCLFLIIIIITIIIIIIITAKHYCMKKKQNLHIGDSWNCVIFIIIISILTVDLYFAVLRP